jgi:hypothetical protein
MHAILRTLTFAGFTVLAQGAGHAADFAVDTSGDAALTVCSDAVPADCSLRGALLNANLTAAPDTIRFDLPITDAGFQPDTQHWRIAVGNAALPPIEAPVLIDGYSQPGAVANTNTPDDGGLNGVLKIEIVPGTSFGTQQNGLDISLNFFAQAPSTFRGLVINRFLAQIQLSGNGAHRIEGCYLGTGVTGTVAAVPGNSGRGTGVRLFGPGDFVIGGTDPAARNLISGMFYAVSAFQQVDGLQVLGNLIGTDASGQLAIPHTSGAALSFSAGLKNARIGGTDSAARNLISGNPLGAIDLSYSGDATPFQGTRIEGNYIGSDVSGQRALPNGGASQPQSAIRVFGANACALEIGGDVPGAANLIAFNAGAGVQVGMCRGVIAHGNRFTGNRGIAIDTSLGSNPDGATPNDAGDADDGGNLRQNVPVLTLPPGFIAQGGGASVALSYVIDSAPANSAYPITVHFYRGGCRSGGRERIASDTYGAAEAQQTRNFVLEGDGNVLPLTVLAVDAAGNTSEFAPVVGDALFADGLETAPAAFGPGQCGGV